MVSYETIDVIDIVNIPKYLIKNIILSGFLKQALIILVLMLLGFGGLLTTKCLSLDNQTRTVTSTDIDLNPDQLHLYPFAVSLDRRDGSCNTADDPFGRVCVPSKFKSVQYDRKSKCIKTLVKHISSKSRCEFDGGK